MSEITYKQLKQAEETRKDYIDKAAEAAKTQANAYTDEQIKNIDIPTPDIPTALPQKYEAFKVQFPQGKWGNHLDKTAAWEEFHKTLWSGSEILTTSSSEAHFITDTVLDYPAKRKYSLLVTVGGAEKELKPITSGYACTENGTVTLNARVVTESNHKTYDNTSIVYVYCPSGSPYIGQSMTAAHYGKKQYLYQLTEGEVILQEPSETENARFFAMLQSIATKNAKLKITLTDNIIEANYINVSKELVTTVYTEDSISLKFIGLVADRVPNKAYGSEITDDMPTCIKAVLEVEYTDEEATKECVYDKIQGESYSFKIGDFDHEESSAFNYYFNGAALIPFSNAQMQVTLQYTPVSGTQKTIQVKSMYGAMDVGDAQYLPFFDVSELFGQTAGTVTMSLVSNIAIENVAMVGRPVTSISLSSNVQNFTDANDEIMVAQIFTLMPESLPQSYKKKAVTLATGGWTAHSSDVSKLWRTVFASDGFEANVFDKTYNVKAGDAIVYSINGNQVNQTVNYNEQGKYWYVPLPTYGSKLQYIQLNAVPTAVNVFVASNTSSSVKVVSGYVQSLIIISIGGVQVSDSVIQSYTDTDVKVDSEVRFTLDEANGKIAGQFGLKKTIDKESGKLMFTADTLPTQPITGTLEIGDTSTEGAAFVEGIIEPDGLDSALTFDILSSGSENSVTVDENGIEYSGQLDITKEDGTKVTIAGSVQVPIVGGDGISLDASSDGKKVVVKTDGSGGVKTDVENTFTAKQTFEDVQVNGNFTAKGTTTVVDVKNLEVEQQLITVAKGNTAALTSPAGIKAEKYDGTKDGALVFDASGTAMVGDVVLDENGNIDEEQSDLQDLATRAKPSELTDGHLLKWDATNKKIVDGGAIPSGGTKGKWFTFTKDNIEKLGGDVNFSMTSSQNYAIGSTSSRILAAADTRGMLQFEVGKTYKLQWQKDGTTTTSYAAAVSTTLSDGTTTAKAEFTVNGKTLVVVDRATATANITSASSLTYNSQEAVAYFSDFSTVEEYMPIHVFTIPKEYYVRIPFDETILSTDIVAIFANTIAPARVYHTSSYIELNYGVSSSVYYLASDPANNLIYNFAEDLIGTGFYLAVVGSSTTGSAFVVTDKQENINDREVGILVDDWVSETGGTFKWTDDGAASSSLIEYGVVWNSEVKLSFDTETDKETFEAAGCKIKSGKAFATPLTITCTTKPTKPIRFTYTVKNNAR